MNNQLDYSVLDDPRLLQFVFYPRADWTPLPAGASDHYIPVEEGISVFGRFYPVGRSNPSILYFHGNGEVACDHDWIAPLYNEIGANLFVVDYRGYGPSNGSPTFSNTSADAHPILEYFMDMLKSRDCIGSLFVMGRSLGSQPAIELAANHPEKINGLILESGFVQNGRLLEHLGLPVSIPNLNLFEKASLEHIGRITIPMLIIHGERDILIPPIEALTIYENTGSKQKKLLTIPGGDHNNLMLIDIDKYFGAIKEFIS